MSKLFLCLFSRVYGSKHPIEDLDTSCDDCVNTNRHLPFSSLSFLTMSWLMNSVSGEEPEKYIEPADGPKVADPSIPNRMVADKAANKPFLA